MKKIVNFIIFSAVLVMLTNFEAKTQILDRQGVIDSLTTMDPQIVQYFPRWKVCEPDLLVQIYQSFLYHGYPESNLSREDIQILAAPREFDYDPFEILMINCGSESMNATEIEATFSDVLVGFLAGNLFYSGMLRGEPNDFARRDYCFTDLPTQAPITPSQADIITDYLDRPTNVDHAFTLSLFEQGMKIGETGFWLRSIMGTDQVGYHFWSAGESKILLQRPLYINTDRETSKGIPYLINAHLGGGYRLSSGLANNNSLLSWVADRTLNAGPGGKLVFGTDVHAWFHPAFGIGLNVELPMQDIGTQTIDFGSYGKMENFDRAVQFDPSDPRPYDITHTVPLLRATGQFTAFYHWWLDKKNPENYFRFDFGINYTEVREAALYIEPTEIGPITKITNEGVDGLMTYKPNDVADWMFFKVSYRSQAAFPFGASIQMSNQVFLARIFIPLFGDWFYLEGKYSTIMRDPRPFEIQNFFMFSPVIRLTI
ncbi:MAG: hypothetical protein KGZ71_02195 [Desulfobulbaceae bacterium]|nr:hypothetical protein [Candidatus Kapabacteria bacterium]MBS3999274.1 hypothetical protein [Desulfobulbaceae bacterium]